MLAAHCGTPRPPATGPRSVTDQPQCPEDKNTREMSNGVIRTVCCLDPKIILKFLKK